MLGSLHTVGKITDDDTLRNIVEKARHELERAMRLAALNVCRMEVEERMQELEAVGVKPE